ncbi:unnamed protein product [Cochlearia groenlandica]
MSVQDLVQQEGRERLIRLDPNFEAIPSNRVTWFRHEGKIPKAILKCIHGMLPAPYPKYRDFPAELREIWFRSFAQEFNWEPQLTSQIQEEFDKACATSYSNHMFEWKEKWRLGGEKPSFLNPSVWDGFKNYWTTEAAGKKAKRNATNRRGGDGSIEKAPPTHNAGANTFEQISDVMRVREGGHEPHWLKVMETTHTNKKTGEIIPKVRNVVERVQTKVTQLTQSSDESTSSNTLTNSEINRLVLEETPMYRGKPYGLGTLPESQETSLPYVPNTDPSLLLEISELKDALRNANKEKDEAIEKIRQETSAQIQKMNEYLMNRFPDYPPGSGSGSGTGI